MPSFLYARNPNSVSYSLGSNIDFLQHWIMLFMLYIIGVQKCRRKKTTVYWNIKTRFRVRHKKILFVPSLISQCASILNMYELWKDHILRKSCLGQERVNFKYFSLLWTYCKRINIYKAYAAIFLHFYSWESQRLNMVRLLSIQGVLLWLDMINEQKLWPSSVPGTF